MNGSTLLVVMFATVGCMGYTPVDPQPDAEAAVRLSFTSPRSIVSRSPAGDSILLRDVTQLRGTVVSVRSDTIYVRLRSARLPQGVITGPAQGTVAAVPRDADVRTEKVSVSGRRTIALVGFLVLGTLSAMVAAIGVSDRTG